MQVTREHVDAGALPATLGASGLGAAIAAGRALLEGGGGAAAGCGAGAPVVLQAAARGLHAPVVYS